MTIMAAVALITAGCGTTRRVERSVSREASTTTGYEYRDTLESGRLEIATTTTTDMTEHRTTHVVTAEGIAAESARLDVPIQSLRYLPDSAGYTAKLQKVVSAVCLADVDIACNELKNARTHLEYAIQEGGTLYVVEDARRMLAEVTKKEQG